MIEFEQNKQKKIFFISKLQLKNDKKQEKNPFEMSEKLCKRTFLRGNRSKSQQ